MLFFYLFIISISIILIFIFLKNSFLIKKNIISKKNPLLIELKLQLNNLVLEFEKNEVDESEYISTKFEIEKRILKEINYSEEKKSSKSTSPILFNKIFSSHSAQRHYFRRGPLEYDISQDFMSNTVFWRIAIRIQEKKNKNKFIFNLFIKNLELPFQATLGKDRDVVRALYIILHNLTRPGLEPGISSSGGRRLIHLANGPTRHILFQEHEN